MSGELIERDALPVVRDVTPMALLQQAIAQGVDVEKLGALMALQERYEANEARKAFVSALNAFKADPPIIYKNTQVDFTSAKGRTHYKHATLDNVSGLIGAGLAKVGIAHRWDTEQREGGMIRVTCILTHALGHSERVWLEAGRDDSGNKNSIQAVVSTVTYLQRQTLLSASGMAVSNTDDDGRQGVVGMTESVKADWLAAIECCADLAATEALWGEIAKSTVACGDVLAHEQMRTAMTAKRKALKAKQKDSAEDIV